VAFSDILIGFVKDLFTFGKWIKLFISCPLESRQKKQEARSKKQKAKNDLFISY